MTEFPGFREYFQLFRLHFLPNSSKGTVVTRDIIHVILQKFEIDRRKV